MRAMRSRIEELEEARHEKIAIIGLACKLPGGVEDTDGYWALLREKTNAVREIPRSRFDLADIYDVDTDVLGKTNSRWAALLDGVDEFDAGFFGISPREAENLDPQQRIFLECVWRALEDAAIAPGSIADSATGVFVGATTHEYANLHAERIAVDEIDRYSGVGMALNAIAGRVSYVLGLHGPSMCIDAACASSLVAVDRACRSLRDDECTMALAGGVNVIAFRQSLITASRSGMLSSSGRVDAFGLGADGFVRGEGCGVVVLKRLSLARRDGDRILAVIAGSAVNHDGPGSGLTVPNGQAQAALLRSALKNAGVAPSQVGYVEAHGTGTRLGDPIEAEALGAVFGVGERERPLAIGSVKTNIGHLEAAAGIAGLIKVVLALEHGEIPAQLYGDPPSEHVRWKDLPLEVVRERRHWEPIGGRRIAGVSGFGFSGTNAHVIVEEAPAVEVRNQEPRPSHTLEVLVLSAKSAASLAMLAQRYAAHLQLHADQQWGDVCFTAALGRTHFKYRLVVVASSAAEAARLLKSGGDAGSVLQGDAAESQAALDLAQAYISGVDVDWSMRYVGGQGLRRVRLPGYAFERERHWLTGTRQRRSGADGEPTGHALLGVRLRLAGEGLRYEWQARAAGDLAWLDEHRVGQGLSTRAILPATAYIEMLLAVGDRLPGAGNVRVDELSLIAPLDLVEKDSAWPVVQVVVEAAESNKTQRSRVRVYSSEQAGSAWRLHGEGYVSRVETVLPLSAFDADAMRKRCTEAIDAATFYALVQARGAHFGPRFQGVRRVWRGKDEAFGEVLIEASNASFGNRLHPASLDACLQIAAALLPDIAAVESAETWLPAKIDGFQYNDASVLPQNTNCFVHARKLASSTADTVQISFNLSLPNKAEPLATIGRVNFRRQKESESMGRPASWIFESRWVPALSRSPQREELSPGNWLIVGDSQGLAAQVAEAVSATGGRSFFVEAGSEYRKVDSERFAVKTDDRGHYAKAFESMRVDGLLAMTGTLRIVYLCSIDAEELRKTISEALLQSQCLDYGACLALVQAVIGQGLDVALHVVTTSASDIKHAEVTDVSSAAGAALASLCRTLLQEHPELGAKYIFLAETPSHNDRDLLFDLLSNRSEPEMMLLGGIAYVPHWAARKAVGDNEGRPAIELSAGATGLIEDLTYAEIKRAMPGDDEVEIEVLATGLNFRDVMKTLKMLDDDGLSLGGECSGVVVRAGKDAPFVVGDEVMAFTAGAFRSYVTVRASNVILKSAALSFAEAASLPIAYMTAVLGLDRLARIRPGESILIHAAAGGLGQAAVQVAKARGARIYATAGSETKREYLRAQGIEFVADSRTVGFASQVLDATGGRGVDVVLNSLAGEFIEESFRALASNGRFLETGKRGVLLPDEAARLYPGVRYFCFDLGEEAERDQGLVPALLRELMTQIESGVLPPLAVESVTFREAAQVFRRMAQARHIGKLAVTHEGRWRLWKKPGTYMVTGGLGALGLGAVDWLFKHGARSFLLLSRQRHPESDLVLSTYRKAQATIQVVYGDCADRDTVQTAIKEISPEFPLRGVIHCAGVLHDGLIPDQDWQLFREVTAPKLDGAWNLHQATEGLPLECFVLFSSASATIGSPGQANYAAANAAMDTVAHLRRTNGLPALTINWGPWMEGMAVRVKSTAVTEGLGSIDLTTGFAIVEQLLQSGTIQATVLSLKGKNSAATASILANSGMSSLVLRKESESSHVNDQGLLAKLTAEPEMRRRSILIDHVRNALQDISGIHESGRLGADTAFFDLGFDSLMAVELRNYLMKSLGRTLPATIALDYPTIESIAEYLSALVSQAGPSSSKSESQPDFVDEDVSGLSETQAEALLLREMGWQGR